MSDTRDMLYLEQLPVAIIFAAIVSRFFRWIIAKVRTRPNGLVAPNVLSLVTIVILFPLLSADGPFANAVADITHALVLYVPAQAICLVYDWQRARGKAALR